MTGVPASAVDPGPRRVQAGLREEGTIKATTRVLLPILVLIGLLWAGPALAARDYVAERFDVALDVQTDGSLLVTETIRFRFEGGPFTYVFRDLAYTKIDEIDRLQAGMDGTILAQGSGPGQLEVVAGRPLEVIWHFSPTSDSVHEFVLTYRVQGPIRQEADADTLLWRAIPEEHDYAIERSRITLRYPPSVPVPGTPELLGATAEREAGTGQVQWTTADVDADESLVVRVRFAPGSLLKMPPRWQIEQAKQQQQIAEAVPVALAAGLLGLALGAAALGRFLVRQRRPTPAAPGLAVRASAPPDATAPGPAVWLVRRGTPALATLFDLANRGVLHIEEERGFLGRSRYRLDRSPSSAELRPHEAGLLRTLFQEGKGAQSDSLPLSRVAARLSSRAKWYQEPLQQEMEDSGLLDPARKAARERLKVLAVAGILAGVGGLIAGFLLGSSAVAHGAGTILTLPAIAAGLGAALVLLGFASLISSAALSPLSGEGVRAAAAWKGFATYLKEIIHGREFVAGEALFERYLPFAAGFGWGVQWAKHFQKKGYTIIPPWFQSMGEDADDFGGVVAVLAATHSSFSGGDGGAAGAAGASGGGASGAG